MSRVAPYHLLPTGPPHALSPEAMAFARAAFSAHTRRAYASQWRLWERHCRDAGLEPLPAEPEAVANWIATRTKVGQAIATLRSAVAALRFAHLAAGLSFDSRHPAIQLVLKGIARNKPRLQKQASPIRADMLREILTEIGASATDLRDAALLALGYCFARRRSELVGLDLDRLGIGTGILSLSQDRIEVSLARSKSHAGSEPEVYAVPKKPNAVAAAAIEHWITFAEIKPGEPVLRRVRKGGRITPDRLDAQSVALILKRRIMDHFVRQGLSPSRAAEAAAAFSGHSLRVGFAVTAAEAGADIGAIQRSLGHRSPLMSSRYAKPAQLIKSSPHLLPGVALGPGVRKVRKKRRKRP